MKLFLKHLLGSIRKKPLQPIILVLTLTLSMLSSVISFSLQGALVRESELEQTAKYGEADFTVTLNSSSKSRFMFASDAEQILGERADVVGCYELLMFDEGGAEPIFGVATDLLNIENIFYLVFTERAEIYKGDLANVALISHELAQRYGLSVGDALDVSLFGDKRTYTVGAVSQSPYLASYDVMVDITGVMRAIGSGSLTAAALGDDFKPSSTLYVDVMPGSSVQECMELLKANDRFDGRTFADVSNAVIRDRNSDNMNVAIDVAIVLTGLLSAFVTFCCLYILSAERAEENMIFISAGARPWQMKCMQYAEVLIYWLVGVLIGSLLYPLAYSAVLSGIGFKYVTPTAEPLDILKSASVMLISALLSVAVFTSGVSAMKRKETGKCLPLVISSAISLALLVALVTVPYGFRAAVCIVALISVLISFFMIVPPLMRLIISALVRWTSQRGKFPLVYALKNLYSVRALHNFTRLTALIVAIVMSTAFVMVNAQGSIVATEELFSADFAIMNATERCYEKVSECDAAEDTARILLKQGSTESGGSITIISMSDIDAVSDRIEIEELPTGDGAILSYGWAKRLSLDIGDRFTVYTDGVGIELTLSGIARSSLGIVILDCESLGLPYNMLISDAKDGKESLLFSQLTERTALELAAVVSTEELMESKISSIMTYMKTGYLILAVAVIFSFTGIVDNLYQSYLSRREEFSLYSLAGMSGKDIKRMKRNEVTLSLAFGLITGALISLLLDWAICQGMFQYGYDIIQNFLEIFK